MNAPQELPKDYLGCIDCTLKLGVTPIELTLDIHGHHVHGFPGSRETPKENGGYVVDRVLLGDNDISSQLPDEAMEALTTYINEVVVDED